MYYDHAPVYALKICSPVGSKGLTRKEDIVNGDGDDCNRNEIIDECEPTAPADFEGDNDVDLSDFTMFTYCVSGPDDSPAPAKPSCLFICLDRFDLDMDGDIDAHDFALFQQRFTG